MCPFVEVDKYNDHLTKLVFSNAEISHKRTNIKVIQ